MSIRPAERKDCPTILAFIKELAAYEKLEHCMVATMEDVEKILFGPNPKAEVLMLEEDGEAAGFALFFHNCSTFLGRYGIYIEDLYVREKFRGRGYGKTLLRHICTIAKDRDCGRVEWWCLDWNQPSIDFYLSLGAEPMSEWTVYRLNKEKIAALAQNA